MHKNCLYCSLCGTVCSSACSKDLGPSYSNRYQLTLQLVWGLNVQDMSDLLDDMLQYHV